MSDLKRLVDEENDELLLEVLRSARDDVPTAKGRARALAAIGAGGATLGVASGAKAGLAVWKWIGIATVVGVTAVSGAMSGRFTASDATRVATHASAQPTTHAVAAPPVASASAASASDDAGSVAVADLPPAPAVSADKPARAAHSANDTASDKGLHAELAALDRARASLAAGDAAGALAELDRYGRTFPAGMLADEATMLRIEALASRGDVAAARALAARFLAAHPDSAYEDRVKTLLELR